MAFGRGKDVLIAENAAKDVEIRMLREQLEDKRLEVSELKASLTRTQDALIAKESPEAYKDQVEARYQAEDEEVTEEKQSEIAQAKEVAQMNEELLRQMESPLFKDADDMFALLIRSEGAPALESLHGDGES